MDKLQLQQGDVCLFTAVIPKDARKKKGNILRHGEATGHAHAVEGTDFDLVELGNRLFVRILSSDCRVIHEEHKAVKLPVGEYEVTGVHEFDHFLEESRWVRD